MKNEKKEFTKAEIEVVRFEKNDVISTSYTPGVIPASHVTTQQMTQEEGYWDDSEVGQDDGEW